MHNDLHLTFGKCRQTGLGRGVSKQQRIYIFRQFQMNMYGGGKYKREVLLSKAIVDIEIIIYKA